MLARVVYTYMFVCVVYIRTYVCMCGVYTFACVQYVLTRTHLTTHTHTHTQYSHRHTGVGSYASPLTSLSRCPAFLKVRSQNIWFFSKDAIQPGCTTTPQAVRSGESECDGGGEYGECDGRGEYECDGGGA